MSEEKEFQRLDLLLEEAFKASDSDAPPGFEARVMAHVMARAAAKGGSLWDALRLAARPLLAAGWAAAAILALVAFHGHGVGQDMAMNAILNGDTLSRWVAM